MADDTHVLYMCLMLCTVMLFIINHRAQERQRRIRRAAVQSRRLTISRRNRLQHYINMRRRQRSAFILFMEGAGIQATTVIRTVWKRTRSTYWWDTVVLPTWDNRDFIENFRINRDTFSFLCDRLRPHLQKEDTRMQDAITVEVRIAATLWKLATPSEYRTIAHLFGIARSSLCEIFHVTCQAIVQHFGATTICFPIGDQLQFAMDGFYQRWGFPYAVAAIDGSHIPIIAPENNHADYFNRKSFYSVILQALVGHNYKFLDINVGWAGSVHDARVFANSRIYSKLIDGNLFPEQPNVGQIPPVILADPAYPLLPNVMKPYSDNGRLIRDQERFNKRLSRARMVVENAFGRLKGRWRCLLKRNDFRLDNVPTVVTTCCILHNICEESNVPFNPQLLEGVDDFDVPNVPYNAPGDATGIRVRNSLMEHFAQQ